MVVPVPNLIDTEYHIKLTWKISRDKIPRNQFVNNITTPEYLIPSFPVVKYRLSFNRISFEDHKIHFHLDKEFFWYLAGKYTLSIERGTAEKLYTGRIEKAETVCCRLKNVLKNEKYFVDQIMTIKFIATLNIPSTTYCWFHEESISKNLWNDDEKDFTIFVGDKELKVHKLILRISSPVFAAMLKSGMKEALESKVEIKGFDFGVIEAAMKFCYGLSILHFINPESAMSMIEFAEIYDIKKLKDQSENFLESVVNGLNVFEILKCSKTSNSSKLEETCNQILDELRQNGLSVNDTDTALDESAFCHVCETI